MTATVEAIDLKDDWIARLTVNFDLWFCARRPTWPTLTRFKARQLIGCLAREEDFIGSLTTKRLMRAVFIIPADDRRDFHLEERLFLRYSDQPQELFGCSVKSLHDCDAAVLVDGAEAWLDVPLFAPLLLEVSALEHGALVDNQVFGTYAFLEPNPIERRRYFLGRWLALENGETHRPTRVVIHDVQ
jgi:hypothetical protein